MEKENEVFLAKADADKEPHVHESATKEVGNRITWKAPEFEHVEKSATWYWGSMAIAIVLIAIALWQKNFLFAVFIVIAELVIFMFAGEKPSIWDFTIDERGVTIEKHKTYRYSDITLYDIHEFSDEYHELVLQTKSKLHHYIKVFIPVAEEERIEEMLNKKLHRGEIEVSFLEFVERLMGF